MSKQGIHFNISERKILLRVADILSVLGMLYLVSTLFTFDYFTVTKENWSWIVVLLLYISVFGTIFELYDLQKASRLDKVIGNIIFVNTFFYSFFTYYPASNIILLFSNYFCSFYLEVSVFKFYYLPKVL